MVTSIKCTNDTNLNINFYQRKNALITSLEINLLPIKLLVVRMPSQLFIQMNSLIGTIKMYLSSGPHHN
jgi:hypothetical protein